MKHASFSLLLVLGAVAPASAKPVDCAALAERAAKQEGIPANLMTAIAQAESGRADDRGTLQPWPWTLNQGGQGSFHDTRDEALQHLSTLLDQGVTNVDIGCMQINYRWHHDSFASVEDMMDPGQNTLYAAQFLRALYDRLGSWDAATAAYHSLDAREGALYLDRVSSLAEGGATAQTALVTAAANVAGLFVLPGAPLINVMQPQPPVAKAIPALPPLEMPAEQLTMMDAQTAPRRLQQSWQEIADFRTALAEQP